MPSILALARKAYDQKKFAKQTATKRRVNAVIAKKTAKAAARKKRQQEAAKKATAEGADAPKKAPKKAAKKSTKKTSDKKKSFKPISTLNKKGPAKKLTAAAKLKAALYKKNKIPVVKKKARVQISTSKRAARMHRKKSWSKVDLKKTVDNKKKATVKKATVKKASAVASKATE